MPYVRLLASFAILQLIATFVFLNVQNIEVGSGNNLVAASVALCFFLVMTSKNLRSQLRLRYSHVYLIGFIAYFLFNLGLDSSDFERIKAFSLGTENGILFSMAIGFAASTAINEIMISSDRSDTRHIASFGVLIFLVASVAWQFTLLQSHLAEVRDDLFLIRGNSGLYQRPGNLLTIQSLISSALVVIMSARSAHFGGIAFSASLISQLASFVLIALIAQLIGSNSAFALSLGLLVLLLVVIYISREGSYQIKHRAFTSKGVIAGWLQYKLLKALLFISAVGGLLLVVAIGVLNLDTSMLRISGFGSGDISSIHSRLEILKNNFSEHFAYSPVFGNTMVDTLTTGEGTYIHSLFSIITHLGLIGFILFTIYLSALYREFVNSERKSQHCGYVFHAYRLYKLFTLLLLLLACALTAFFTWAPMWFVLGSLVLGFNVMPDALSVSTSAKTEKNE